MGSDDPEATLDGPCAGDPHATRHPATGSGPDQSAAEPAAGGPGSRRVGNYVLERELGRGGMGAVFLAQHSQLSDRRYAVKLISAAAPSADAGELFRREVEAIGKSRHPNLLYALDAGSHEGSLYLVTEFVAGRDIGRILRDHGPLPVATACEIGRQMAAGLAFAHEKGIVHRDIKPQNVMLEPSGRVKILDLGLASVRDATAGVHRADEVVGTPPYMPPEQWMRGEPVTTAADLYALGCTLFEMLAGRTPFAVAEYPNVEAQRQAHLGRLPPRLSAIAPHVPADVARLIDRCLDKRPEQRPQSTAEVATILEPHAAPIVAADFLSDATGVAAPGPTAGAEFDAFIDEPRPPDTARTRWSYLLPVAAGLFVSLGGLTLAYYGPGATAAWNLRFDRLGEPGLPSGTGFAIEATRALLFLALVSAVAYLRFRLPLQRFLSPRFHTARVWVARSVFGGAMLVFLVAEFKRQWDPANAAAAMTAWAAERGIQTTPLEEVVPYRWYLGYSFVNYTVVFGGLLLLPILQFLLADLTFLRRAARLFAAAQREEPNAMTAIDRLYAMARMLRRLAARYVDTAGVLAIGVQYEYWIGRWTLTETGYLIEVAGMLVTAGIMVVVLGFVAVHYAEAMEETTSGRGGGLDHRVEQRVQQFSLAWFLRTAIFSRASGIALVSLVLLAIVAGRRSVP